MNRLFPILAVVVAAMFAYAPFMIMTAPYDQSDHHAVFREDPGSPVREDAPSR